MGRTMTLEEVKGLTVHDLLQEVVQGHEPVTVILEDGQAVTLEEDFSTEPLEAASGLKLKPLMTLPGFVPDGWEDALYESNER